jgi:hypothetical protein
MQVSNQASEKLSCFVLPILQGFQRNLYSGQHELARLWHYSLADGINHPKTTWLTKLYSKPSPVP